MKTRLVLFTFTLIGAIVTAPVILSADSVNTTALVDTADHTSEAGGTDPPDLTGLSDVGPRLTLSEMLHDPDPLPFSFRPYPSQYRLSEDGLQRDVFRYLTEAALTDLESRQCCYDANEARQFMDRLTWRVSSENYKRFKYQWPMEHKARISP